MTELDAFEKASQIRPMFSPVMSREGTFADVERWDFTDDHVILDFEATNPTRKERSRAALMHFKVSETRYYQRLNSLMNQPESLEYDPALIYRLRAMRARALAQRVSFSFTRKAPTE